MSEYFVPAGSGEAEFVEKRSSFLGHVRFVETEDAARDFINEMKKKHYDARHNCWCYIIREGAVRYSDDGEPQGTAGLPMLEVFKREGVENVVWRSSARNGRTAARIHEKRKGRAGRGRYRRRAPLGEARGRLPVFAFRAHENGVPFA